jgi:hypothetical protein
MAARDAAAQGKNAAKQTESHPCLLRFLHSSSRKPLADIRDRKKADASICDDLG